MSNISKLVSVIKNGKEIFHAPEPEPEPASTSIHPYRDDADSKIASLEEEVKDLKIQNERLGYAREKLQESLEPAQLRFRYWLTTTAGVILTTISIWSLCEPALKAFHPMVMHAAGALGIALGCMLALKGFVQLVGTTT